MAAEEQDEVANPATEILLCLLSYGPILRKIGQDTENVVNEVLKALLGRMIGGMGEPGAGIDDWLREEDVRSRLTSSLTCSLLPKITIIQSFLRKPWIGCQWQWVCDRCRTRHKPNETGGRNLLPSFSNHLRALINEPDWRCRYSGLVAIAAVAAGTAEVSHAHSTCRLHFQALESNLGELIS